MKKIIPMFALMTSVLTGCGSKNNGTDPNIISLDEQSQKKEISAKASACIIEVPCNMPALDKMRKTRTGALPNKYYDFCDSVVIISGDNGSSGGPYLSIRPITELRGNERKEKDAAFAKYQKMLQLNN